MARQARYLLATALVWCALRLVASDAKLGTIQAFTDLSKEMGEEP